MSNLLIAHALDKNPKHEQLRTSGDDKAQHEAGQIGLIIRVRRVHAVTDGDTTDKGDAQGNNGEDEPHHCFPPCSPPLCCSIVEALLHYAFATSAYLHSLIAIQPDSQDPH